MVLATWSSVTVEKVEQEHLFQMRSHKWLISRYYTFGYPSWDVEKIRIKQNIFYFSVLRTVF